MEPRKGFTILVCSGCGESFYKRTSDLNRAKRDKGQINFFCNPKCFGKNSAIKGKANCLHCKNEFKQKDVGQKFCSRSCAASHNNKVYPKRADKNSDTLKTVCKCGKTKHPRAVVCNICKKENILAEYERATISDYSDKNFKYRRSCYGSIRTWARHHMKEWGIEKECKVCGFNHYVEVCHIKPISEFSTDTLVTVVNDRRNLVYLCPNHHKMLDGGMLDREALSKST